MNRNFIFKTFFAGVAMCAALLTHGSTAQAATYTWDFSSIAGLSAAGILTVDPSGDVTALSGTVGGTQPITFYTNPNFPSTATYQNVPNTGGANYTYDDLFNPTTNAVTIFGLLFSVGTGPNQTFYDLSVDGGPPSASADLFSITSNGTYVQDEGTLSSSPSEAPLPASWTMMLGGLALLGFVSYRRMKKNTAAVMQR